MIDLAHIPLDELLAPASRARRVDIEGDVVRRALVAFLKGADPDGVKARPIGISSAEKSYVALVRQEGIEVYRVRNDLQLKRLRRVPESVGYFAELCRRDNS